MLTVCISSRNRLESLTRCIKSVALISDLVNEVIVVDDCSDEPLEGPLRRKLGGEFNLGLQVIRQEENTGPCAARNLIISRASSSFILNLDDDTVLLNSQSVKRALDLILQDDRVGAVAFAQTDQEGAPWPSPKQPAPTEYSCYVASFIGYACLLRREVFLALGGYRSRFHYYGEEKEYCLRMLDAGYQVVYLPDARVVHLEDPAGRNLKRILRLTVRNNCLSAIYNEPWALMLVSIPARLFSYFKLKRAQQVKDAGGLGWVIHQLVSMLPLAWQERRPLRWSTFKCWWQLNQSCPAYLVKEEYPTTTANLVKLPRRVPPVEQSEVPES